jgi:uncharacterized protein YraI
MTGDTITIQGQATGQAIGRVDVVVDSKAYATLSADDKSKGVSSMPVVITWTTQVAGAHFVQINVYGLDDKLIAKSDAIIFTTKAAALPTPTVAPPTPTVAPTIAPAPTVEVTTTTGTTNTVAITTTAGATNTTGTTASSGVSPSVTISNEFANIRSGPGVEYALVGKLNQKDTAPLRGKNADGTWWQIGFAAGPNGLGWVRGDLVQAANATNVPVVQAPPTPTPLPATATSAAPAAPTATPPSVAAATATAAPNTNTSGPACDASSPEWRGNNANYPFCGKQDPTWGDPQGEWNVYDNGRDIPLFITWNLYGSAINQVSIHFDQSDTICSFARPAQRTVNQVVPAAGRFDFNIKEFPYGGTYKVYLMVNLTDGRTVQYGEKKLCIR